MTIRYSIRMHNYWHCGSGLAAGADVDALVIKDKDQLPYIPGKTVKGLVREAVDNLLFLRGEMEMSQEYKKVLGYFEDKSMNERSLSFFTNASINAEDAKAIIENGLAKYLYASVANTAINDAGVAQEHSLRKTQVTLPCELIGEIYNVPEGMREVIVEAFGMIKNLGVGRNRGLGRCTWKEI